MDSEESQEKVLLQEVNLSSPPLVETRSDPKPGAGYFLSKTKLIALVVVIVILVILIIVLAALLGAAKGKFLKQTCVLSNYNMNIEYEL